MTQDEIIELAKWCGVTHRTWDYQDERAIESFFQAAQRQAYERAASVCEKEAVDPHNVPAAIVARRCSDAIRALIEGDE